MSRSPLTTRAVRSAWLFGVVIMASAASAAAGCGSSDESLFPNGTDAAGDDDGGTGDDASFGTFGDGGGSNDGAFGDATNNNGPLVIAPATPVVDVYKNLTTATVTQSPASLTFTATLGGRAVSPIWSLDRGEIGSIDKSSGAFTTPGTLGGTANVTAAYGSTTASVPVVVRIHTTQNGGVGAVDGGIADGGPGGFQGVGGKGFGTQASGAQAIAFQADASVAPVNVGGGLYFPDGGPPGGGDAGTAKDFEMLYPYDGTVFPRGLLPPLLQWRTTHAAETVAVQVRLTEKNYSFEGFYAFPAAGAPGFTDDDRSRQPIDPDVWKQATYSNTGGADYLRVDVNILTTGGTVYGPATEYLSIAPGVLKGTVYYNTYESTLNNKTGGVLAIKPGAAAPTLAVPALKGKCHVCHSVSADGKTLFVQDYNYDYGSSYDLTQNGALIESYHDNNADGGTSNSGKFTFSGPYPDGTFAMACSGPSQNWHHYVGNSDLFTRAGANISPSSGFTSTVKQAVTPAFSPDGKHVTFSLWSAQTGADAGATTGSKSLMAMDFSCGAPSGSTACADGGTSSFTGLRQLFATSGTGHYVAWPSFTPDGAAVIFQSTLHPAPTGSPIYTHGDDNGGYPNGGALAELRYVNASGTPTPRALCALNGLAPGCDTTRVSTLPPHATFRKDPSNGANTLYELYDDTELNFEPTLNPVPSGGYYWVVFTTRRRYGNVASGYPYDGFDGQSPFPNYPITKKLWVAAIDANTGAVNPSHPAFYLPGQEIVAGNMRGFWVVNPCHANGTSCETGDECCNGFCRAPDDGGALVCSDKPVGGCSQEFENCTTTADCCGAPQGYTCVNNRCAKPSTPPPPPR